MEQVQVERSVMSFTSDLGDKTTRVRPVANALLVVCRPECLTHCRLGGMRHRYGGSCLSGWCLASRTTTTRVGRLSRHTVISFTADALFAGRILRPNALGLLCLMIIRRDYF